MRNPSHVSDPARWPDDSGVSIDEPIDLRRLAVALRRSRFLIAGIIAVLTFGVLAISLVLPKNYRATAKVVLDPEGAGSADAESVRRHLFTMRALVTTPEVLRTAATRLAGETTESVKDKTQPSVDPETNIITITVTDTDATGAARMANTVALTFVEKRTEAERQRLRRERAELLGELNRLRATPEPGAPIRPIRERLGALRVLEARAGSEMQLAEFAEPPSDAWSPHPVRNAILAFLAAVVIAVLAALARQHLAPRIGSVGDLTRLTGLPVLNAVPTPAVHMRQDVGRSRDGRQGGLDDAATDAYRALSASIALELGRDRQQTMLVTGTRQDESKPAVTATLARALAEAGGHTLLVSADLRSPPLGGTFGVPQAPGLAELLAGVRAEDAVDRETIAGAIHRVPTQAGEGVLHILPSGRAPESPVSLFTGDALDRVFGEINRLDYTYVLIDGPPLLWPGESQILARRVDCALIVSRLDELTVNEVGELRETVNRLGVRTLGFAVITGRRKRRVSAPTAWRLLTEPVSAFLTRAAASTRSVVGDHTAGGATAARDRRARPAGSFAEGASHAASETSSPSVGPGDRLAPATPAKLGTPREQRILEVLISFGKPVKEDELRVALGYSRSTLARHLERLAERAEVVRSGSGRRGDPYVYEPGPQTSVSTRAE